MLADHVRAHADSEKATTGFTDGSPRMRWQSPTSQACRD